MNNSDALISIAMDSPDLTAILISGRVIRDQRIFLAFPQEVISEAHEGSGKIIFRLADPAQCAHPSILKRWWHAVRAGGLSATVLPLFSFFVFGIQSGWGWSLPFLFTSVLGVVALHLSVHALSDVEDHLRCVDIPMRRSKRGGGTGALQQGWVSAGELRRWGYGMACFGVVLGIPAVLREPLILSWVGLGGLLAVLGYSGRPVGLKYRGLGDVAIFLALGPGLAVGFCWAVFGTSGLGVLELGVYFGMAASAVHHAGNLQDFEQDLSRGVSTLATVIGFRNAKLLMPALYLLANVSVAWGVWQGWFTGWVAVAALVLIPFQWRLCARALQASGPASALLESVRPATVALQLGMAALMGIALLLG